MKKVNYAFTLIGIFITLSIILAAVRRTEAFQDAKKITADQIARYSQLISIADENKLWNDKNNKESAEQFYIDNLTKDDVVAMNNFLNRFEKSINTMIKQNNNKQSNSQTELVIETKQLEQILMLFDKIQTKQGFVPKKIYKKTFDIIKTQNMYAITEFIRNENIELEKRLLDNSTAIVRPKLGKNLELDKHIFKAGPIELEKGLLDDSTTIVMPKLGRNLELDEPAFKAGPIFKGKSVSRAQPILNQ